MVLIDEIDKADPSVPNALLDALGRGAFDVPGDRTIDCRLGTPLVIITSNRERELPAAFVRRCVVLHLELPRTETEFVERMAQRAQAHLEADASLEGRRPGKTVLREAARQLWRDRRLADESREPRPGQAELIDLVWALARLCSTDEERRGELDEMSRFVFDKKGSRPKAPKETPTTAESSRPASS